MRPHVVQRYGLAEQHHRPMLSWAGWGRFVACIFRLRRVALLVVALSTMLTVGGREEDNHIM
jgi:hypothetical protein